MAELKSGQSEMALKQSPQYQENKAIVDALTTNGVPLEQAINSAASIKGMAPVSTKEETVAAPAAVGNGRVAPTPAPGKGGYKVTDAERARLKGLGFTDAQIDS